MALAQVRDVAKLAGVSPATVSNALNHPERVSASTRKRIQEAIDELGYVRNDAARQLRAGSNRAVGMILLDVGNPFFAEVARGAENQLITSHRPLLLSNSNQDAEREAAQLGLFEEQRLAGVLVTPVGNVLQRLRRLKERGTAVVIVDRKTGADEFSSVSVDDKLGGRLAVDHLIEHGRQHIAMVGGPQNLRQIKHRLQGAQQRVQQSGTATLVFHETPTTDVAAGRQATLDILAEPRSNRPDAIFAANDLIALGVLQELVRAGVSVPDDIALIGYDNIQFSASATTPITSIRQPAEEMGSRAAELLCDVIDKPGAPVQHTVFQPEVVVRESTAGV